MAGSARPIRQIVRLAVPVVVATVLVALAIIDVALVRTFAPAVGTIGPGTARHGLYYSLTIVGLLAIITGVSVRLRRPNDSATLHFFWLTAAFFGVMAYAASGRHDRFDVFFSWLHIAAMLALPPLYLHFAFVFPERPDPWAKTDAGRAILPVIYVPALLLGGARATMMARAAGLVTQPSQLFGRIDLLESIYLATCLLAGLYVAIRTLTRMHSTTARRQFSWVLWGWSVGAVPIVLIYLVPFIFGSTAPYAEYTAVLLGGIPVGFASALVRYRLTDVEVLVRRAVVVVAFVLLLVAIYYTTLTVVGVISGPALEQNHFWALFATLIVALVAPWLWQTVRAALDRLYNPARYDYRRALVTFTRELNSDLDLDRLSRKLVTRVRETLGVDRLSLMLADPSDQGGNFKAIAWEGLPAAPPPIARGSALGGRVGSGHTVVIDDQVPVRRLSEGESTAWRDAGLYCFVPCVSNETTTAVIAVGRKAGTELVSTEDLALLGAVAGQAATALENARLYAQLRQKADEIERLRQFSDSVVESLSDGLMVVDLDDRVLRWNHALEAMLGIERGRATGRHLPALFEKSFVQRLFDERRESPTGATLYRVPLTVSPGGQKKALLVNAGVAPFLTAERAQAGWIIVIEDITDRANLEEQLRLSEKMAAIGLLAAGVAHEVNTPLTGISSFTQMLLDKSDDADPNRQLLEKIERQTFRAAKIVNSLLNLARPAAAEAGPVELNSVIGDVLSLLEHQFRTSRIQVRREFDPPEVTVRGEEYKLQQVFLNLFLNARDAMPKGGWLSVSTRVEHGSAIVEVADTGVGIPAEHVSRIYDPFFTTKGEGRGTGLGLSVTYGIVQEHNGTLTCESDVGQGTRFTLVLPVATESSHTAINS